MPRAFVIDPPLRNSAGHHRALAVGWANAAHENGYDVEILGHVDGASDTLDGFDLKRVFSGGYYAVTTGRHLPLATQLRLHQTAFRDTLSRSLRGVRRDDVLILTFPTAFTMNGMAAWASGLPEQERPRLIAWLLTSPVDDEFAKAMQSPEIVIAAYDRLRGLFGDRASILSSTPSISAECRRLGAGDFPVVPFVALRAPLLPRPAAAAADAPLLGVLGDINQRKGSSHIAPVIRAIDGQDLAARWLVAGAAEFAPPADIAALQQLARLKGGALRLDLHAGGLEEYDGVLRSLDLAVLPYSPDFYASRGSGIAEEAALIGVPIVAPAVIAANLPGATAFEGWTSEAIAAAVAEAIRRLPELTEAARAAAAEQASALRRERIAILARLFPPPGPEPTVSGSAVAGLPQVDVVVTLHNYRNFIRQCLESVARQSYPNWRCVVVDDASGDLSFDEGRALVAGLGPRFTYERHAKAEGQLRAMATGMSLGSGQFVALLDADDYLDEHALDHHIAWHLNSVDPVALTSGSVAVIDGGGTQVAGALDTHIWKSHEGAYRLAADRAFARPGAPIVPGEAVLIDQTETNPGVWFWNPTSTMVLRRAAMELITPEAGDIGRHAGDTYFGMIGHAVGGSLCFNSTVAYYRRHGDNGYSNAPVIGTGTLPVRESSSNWPTIAAVFDQHLRASMPMFDKHIGQNHINRLLAMSTRTRSLPRPDTSVVEVPPAARLGHWYRLHGEAAADAMTYPELVRYVAARLWRGGTRRLTHRAPAAAKGGADTLTIRELADHLVRRTRRGLDRRFRR